MSEFDKYQGLADVTFSIYNVTSEFYEQRAAGATHAAKQAVQSLTPGKPVARRNHRCKWECHCSVT